MTARDELIGLLARLISDGVLTEARALELLREFDQGDGEEWDLPLTPVATRERNTLTEAAIGAALGALLGSLNRRRLPSIGRGAPTLLDLSVIDRLQTTFEQQVRRLAQQAAAGQLSMAQWQTGMMSTINDHMTQQMLYAGRTNSLSPRQLQTLQTAMNEQAAFLSRFADEAALHARQGQPFSEAYLANRGQAYGGMGRGLAFSENEMAQVEAGNADAGFVIRYVSRDDRGTCSPCLSAEGFYLPGEGPMPGQVCLGRSNCRCRREWVFSVEEYERLGGA